ncbi:MAG: hypothetical protein WD691_03825 [Acidimicrobiales bacterium]
MSDSQGPDGTGEGVGGEVVDLARALRSELQALDEGELRRQARVVAFDQHMAQMEASIRSEVERLRTTGSVVELLADLLRQSLAEVQSDRRFEPIQDQLTRLRDQISALPSPDLEPLGEQLDQLHVRVAAIATRDLRPIHDRLEALGAALESLPAPDDSHLREELRSIRDTLSSLPTLDLSPIQSSVTELQAQIGALPMVDLAPMHADVRQLLDGLAALPPVDLDPLHAQLLELQSQVRDLPFPDDSAVQSSVAGVAEQVTDLRRSVEALPPPPEIQGVSDQVARLGELVQAIPVHDDLPLREEVQRLATELDGLRTAMADRFDAIPTPAQLAEVLSPALELIRTTADPAAVLDAVDQLSATVAPRLAGLGAATDRLDERVGLLPDHTERIEELASTRETVEREIALLASAIAEVADRTQPLAALESQLSGIRAAVTRLEVRADASLTDGREAADAQALAVARVTAATDGFASTVGTLRSAVVNAAREAGDETIASIDERLDGRLRNIETRLNEALNAALRPLDPLPLHERLHERLHEIDDRIAGLPLPDLGPVAAQLARLSATITSETRVRPAGASQLEAVATALAESTVNVLAQLDSQGAQVRVIAERMAALPSPAETRALVHEQVAPDLAALREQLSMLTERVDGAAVASERAATIALQLTQANAKPGAAKKPRAATKATTKTAVSKKKVASKSPAPRQRGDADTPPNSDR